MTRTDTQQRLSQGLWCRVIPFYMHLGVGGSLLSEMSRGKGYQQAGKAM